MQGIRRQTRKPCNFKKPKFKRAQGSNLEEEPQMLITHPGSRPAFAEKGNGGQTQNNATFSPLPFHHCLVSKYHKKCTQLHRWTHDPAFQGHAASPSSMGALQISPATNHCCHKLLLCAGGSNELKHQQYHQALSVALALHVRQLVYI